MLIQRERERERVCLGDWGRDGGKYVSDKTDITGAGEQKKGAKPLQFTPTFMCVVSCGVEARHTSSSVAAGRRPAPNVAY